MNFERYPWLKNLTSDEARSVLGDARDLYAKTGAVTFPEFLTSDALSQTIAEVTSLEDSAFTTDGTHTPHLLALDASYPADSVRNFEMRTRVASIAYDELRPQSALAALYQNPILLELVSIITGKAELHLSEDPIGCCTVNVFRENYYHSFHFDESEFSTTLMLQEAEDVDSGLFQYTSPLRRTTDDLALEAVAAVVKQHHLDDRELADARADGLAQPQFCEHQLAERPDLHTLDFKAGTLSVFSGSRSLHRVTRIMGKKSRLVAVLTFASRPGFRNSKEVQELFWGRSSR